MCDFCDESGSGPTRFIYAMSCQNRKPNATGECGNFYSVGIFDGNESEWLSSYFSAAGGNTPPPSPPSPPSPATAVLIWASQPTFANETLQLCGGGLLDDAAATATVDGAPVELFDRSATAAKLTLPVTLKPGRYTVCVKDSCIVANAPDLFWKRGDVNLTAASQGGWIRIFGRFGDVRRLGATQLVLSPGGSGSGAVAVGGVGPAPHVLSSLNETNNDGWFQIPETLSIGTYQLALRGAGGDDDFPVDRSDRTITIVSAESDWQRQPQAMRVYPVGPCKQGGSPSACPALWAALNATRIAGGGTILLARGTYRFQGESLDLPPFVTLKGVSTAHVTLLWDTGAFDKPFVDVHTDKRMPRFFVGKHSFQIEWIGSDSQQEPSNVGIRADLDVFSLTVYRVLSRTGGNHTFAVEDLTINSARFYNNIITDQSAQSRNHRVQRVRIRADCFYRLIESTVARRGGTIANYTYEDVGCCDRAWRDALLQVV